MNNQNLSPRATYDDVGHLFKKYQRYWQNWMQFSAVIKLIISPEATVLANMHVPCAIACENYLCQHFQSQIIFFIWQRCSFRQVQMWMLLQILIWLTFKAGLGWSDEDKDVENPEMEFDYEKNDEKGRLVQMWTLAWNFDLTDTQTQSRFWPLMSSPPILSPIKREVGFWTSFWFEHVLKLHCALYCKFLEEEMRAISRISRLSRISRISGISGMSRI